MIKLRDVIYYDGSSVLVKKDNKVEHINKEQLNEYADLGAPVKKIRKQLKIFSNELDRRRGGSFDADAGEYVGFEGGDDKLYGKRYKQLSAWEKKVNKTLTSLLKDYERAWKK